jgi:hypothetical protein
MRVITIVEEISEEFPPKVCEKSYSFRHELPTVHLTRDSAELEDAPEG